MDNNYSFIINFYFPHLETECYNFGEKFVNVTISCGRPSVNQWENGLWDYRDVIGRALLAYDIYSLALNCDVQFVKSKFQIIGLCLYIHYL